MIAVLTIRNPWMCVAIWAMSTHLILIFVFCRERQTEVAGPPTSSKAGMSEVVHSATHDSGSGVRGEAMIELRVQLLSLRPQKFLLSYVSILGPVSCKLLQSYHGRD